MSSSSHNESGLRWSSVERLNRIAKQLMTEAQENKLEEFRRGKVTYLSQDVTIQFMKNGLRRQGVPP